MGGIPLGVRILGPLVLSGAVVNNPMADVGKPVAVNKRGAGAVANNSFG